MFLSSPISRDLSPRQFFNVPDNVVRGLSPECMDFMMSFVCESSSRLGRRNVDEIKNHPWFASVVSAQKEKQEQRGGAAMGGGQPATNGRNQSYHPTPRVLTSRRHLGPVCCSRAGGSRLFAAKLARKPCAWLLWCLDMQTALV